MIVLDLDQPAMWPAELIAYLDDRHDVFLDWEPDGRHDYSAASYDAAYIGLHQVLQPYFLKGWHCTRLTDFEIADIMKNGMHLPSADTLATRISALVTAGLITNEIAQLLVADNQASSSSRAGMVWFCFFYPRLAGERGIERFFRHWGGEALYVSHERHALTAAILRKVGIPCIVEANIPIASLAEHGGLPRKIARRYLVNKGYQTREPVDHEDRIKRPLAAEYVRQIISFPEAEFCSLTGCLSWQQKL